MGRLGAIAVTIGAVATALGVFLFAPTRTAPDPEVARRTLDKRIQRIRPLQLASTESDPARPIGPGSSEIDLLTHFHELNEQGALDGRLTMYPYWTCEIRCDDDGPEEPAWPGSRPECLQACALDYLARHPGLDAAFAVMLRAMDDGDAELFRDVVHAYPEIIERRRDTFTRDHPERHLLLVWSDAMARNAPDVQASLYAFGRQSGGVVGNAAVLASGAAACVQVGDEAVCEFYE